MTTTRARVVVLVGTGRSGSTIVSNLISSSPGFVGVGELRYLWQRGLHDRAACGCGDPVDRCVFWSPVLRDTHAGGHPVPAVVAQAERRLLRLRDLGRVLRHHRRPVRRDGAAAAYADEVARVCLAVARHSGGATVVDSSKLLGYALLLDTSPDLDVHVLHLVRDPRAAAFSWSKVRDRSDRGATSVAMGRESPARSAALWTIWNGLAGPAWSGRPGRYHRVRYEDVMTDPVAALRPLFAALGEDAQELPVDGSTAHLSTVHSVAGNPARMARGAVALTVDDEWARRMPRRDLRIVTVLSAALLHRFGYPLRPRSPEAGRVFVEDLTGVRRGLARVGRNASWVREQGLGRVLEEKEIDPLRTVPAAARKWRYRRAHAGEPPSARPVFLVGLQRSGTNMIVRGLGYDPSVEVHNENDPQAFERYKLRPDAVIERLIATSRHSVVLFKPLCDSHRTDHLLDSLRAPRPGRAVWAFRDVDGRVRSALAKFGDGNRQVLREFASGVNVARWHVQRMSAEAAGFVRSFDYDAMSPESGAALMWWVRNRLVFDLGLHQRTDVRLVSYDRFLVDPATVTRDLCSFLEFPYSATLHSHVHPRPPTYREPLDIDPRIRAACEDLGARLLSTVEVQKAG